MTLAASFIVARGVVYLVGNLEHLLVVYSAEVVGSILFIKIFVVVTVADSGSEKLKPNHIIVG